MASFGNSAGGAKTKTASGSMNRLISQADATRSTCGRGRGAQRPPPPPQLAQVEARLRFWLRRFRTSGTHGDGLLETSDLGAAGSVEEVDVADSLIVLRE